MFNNVGNIGIGTTLPGAALHAEKNVGGGALSLFRNTSASPGSVSLKVHGAYGQYESDKYSSLGGYKSVNYYGAYGQFSSANYGFLGSSNIGVYGRTYTADSSGYGGYFENISSYGRCTGIYASAKYTGGTNICGIKAWGQGGSSSSYAGFFNGNVTVT